MQSSAVGVLILVITLLCPLRSSAALLIYRGAESESIVGENNGLRLSSKSILVIDAKGGANIRFTRILYTVLHGAKRYSVKTYTNAHFLTVTGPGTKSFTVVTRIPTDCDAQENPGGEGVYFKGPNALVKVSNTDSMMFARTFTDKGNGLSHSSSSNEPILTEGSLLAVYRQAETMASNAAGETLEAAVARLKGLIESQGYVP